MDHAVSLPTPLRYVRIRRSPLDPRRGLLLVDGRAIPCALGRSGIAHAKREGDGTSPAALLRPLAAFYRPDRGRRPVTRLDLRPIRRRDGWCDDPAHSRYNQPVTLPFEASHERLWRDDRLYDLVVDLDWNRRPAIRGRGSAIFLHVARPGLLPTDGCVALPYAELRRLVGRIGPGTRFLLT
jgi:L,D-peptidoglycan transpeptidase YkuD (ErfK/YbiS/YcfS/YnhG family)